MTVTVIDGCAIATVDDAGTEYECGHIVLDGSRIVQVGSGTVSPEQRAAADTVIDATGCLATPGLVNCHHHLYQWLTRGFAQDSTLFEWLVELYPVWSGIDDELVATAARAGLVSLAGSGCSTSTDHHYIFPPGANGSGSDALAAEIGAAREVGVRFHPCRGSMDLGVSQGGLPPDELVEERDAILTATADAIDRFHDAAFDSMLRIAVAPCSPFSVTPELMREAAELARGRGVRMHTHLAETDDELVYCSEHCGSTPVEYMQELGWLGNDVWLAHCVHLSPSDIELLARTGTGVAHCPGSNGRLGAGIAPVPELVGAGVAVGLGVDGAASAEWGELAIEMREALLMARARGGPRALSARGALELATRHGARCLGREAEIGSLEPGKLADVALWRLDSLAHAGIADPVAALVLGPPRAVDTLLVQGEVVVRDGRVCNVDEQQVARELRTACSTLAGRVGVAAR